MAVATGSEPKARTSARLLLGDCVERGYVGVNGKRGQERKARER